MSAYVVDSAHIDMMLSVAINGPREMRRGGWSAPYVSELLAGEKHTGPLTRESAELAGRALLAECIASVSYRYGAEPAGPGPISSLEVEHYEWTDYGRPLTVAEACCAIDGFESQSCEHPGWWDSGAHHFCQRFRRALVRCLPGYDDANWHWTAETALVRARQFAGWRGLISTTAPGDGFEAK